ncbi:hypothetical protein [Arthrobacter caoxuetaonis]|uniref:EVE domain-containing protein n=1 Tax=Arthrobacter caoxuetaonis TaxID=2886935 RepID=A0A9X1SFC0_9MICC|nr:hypothetical protein [Arthrobacter caoxuetaonis]MCC3298469.1 hypothetical protein [Arthrobacter caoxuetaonis]USQ57519.1 hypothetical protein NF551_01245 [Arthrobacter caoxuetaonis]
MAWYLCAISPNEPRNWQLCKERGLWGYTRGTPKCEAGDHLLFWIGKRGYIGYGLVTDMPRRPRSKADAPWAGGTDRFTAVVPMTVQVEIAEPVFLPFVNNVQQDTGFNTGQLQRGMSLVPNDAATRITARLLERYFEAQGEAEGSESPDRA